MGRYATTTSISTILPNILSGNTTTSDSEGVNVWSTSCDMAEAQVNSALVAKYDPSTWTTTGSPAIPTQVRKLANELTALYFMRAAVTQDAQVKNANLPTWEEVKADLEAIRNGDMKLTYTDGSLVPTRSSSRITSSTIGYSHIFGLDDEKNWDVDADETDDIADERAA